MATVPLPEVPVLLAGSSKSDNAVEGVAGEAATEGSAEGADGVVRSTAGVQAPKP